VSPVNHSGLPLGRREPGKPYRTDNLATLGATNNPSSRNSSVFYRFPTVGNRLILKALTVSGGKAFVIYRIRPGRNRLISKDLATYPVVASHHPTAHTLDVRWTVDGERPSARGPELEDEGVRR
jgi:hypothetical protein